MKIYLLFILTLFILTLNLASAEFVYDNSALPRISTTPSDTSDSIPSNYTSNYTECWSTAEGIKCDVADITYDEISGGDVNALGYTGYFNFIQGVVGALSIDGDPWWLAGVDLQIDRNLLVDGNLSVGQFVLSNLLPYPTLTLALGSGANRWLWLYVQNISAENIEAYNLHLSENLTIDGFINGVNISKFNETASLEWTDSNAFWAERATPLANGAWAWGNGQTPQGSVVGYNDTHIVKIGVECATVGTTMQVVVRKNAVATTCAVTVGNTANKAYIADCNVYFNDTDILGIYTGTITGTYGACVGTVWVERTKSATIAGLKGEKGDTGTGYNSTYNNLLAQNCPQGQVVNGTLSNGTLKCTTVASGSSASSFWIGNGANIYFNQSVGINTTTESARLTIETTTTYAKAVITLHQRDVDQPFMNLTGGTPTEYCTGNNVHLGTNSIAGSYKVWLGGVGYVWVPYVVCTDAPIE